MGSALWYDYELTGSQGLSVQAFPHVTTSEDIANAIVFLASSAAAAISGTNLIVDCAFLTGMRGDHVPSFESTPLRAIAISSMR